jgi:hypothetical protein
MRLCAISKPLKYTIIIGHFTKQMPIILFVCAPSSWTDLSLDLKMVLFVICGPTFVLQGWTILYSEVLEKDWKEKHEDWVKRSKGKF